MAVGLGVAVRQDRGMDVDRNPDLVAISLVELRSILAVAIDAIEDVHGSTVRVDADHYWTLFVREQFDLAVDRPTATVGQLTDDVESVRNLLARGGQEPLWHFLQHAIGLLAGAASTTLDHLVEVPPPHPLQLR